MPLLSVVMSTYNREHLVKETMESVLNQSFSDFEFIVIDDCSTDNTSQILHSFDDNRIKILKNSQNNGCTFNYHIAHNLSKGKYIAHIDDDDICLPNRFEKQLDFLNQNEEISIISGCSWYPHCMLCSKNNTHISPIHYEHNR